MRWQAAGLFAAGVSAPRVARILEVSQKSAYQWRRAWKAGGTAALASRGAPGPEPKLSDSQLQRLRERLDAGPAAAGYPDDQRWTLARVVALIATLFHLRVGITTAWQAMQRLGYTAQLPVHRAIERDEDTIAHWRRYRHVQFGGPQPSSADDHRLHGACRFRDRGTMQTLRRRQALRKIAVLLVWCRYRPGSPAQAIGGRTLGQQHGRSPHVRQHTCAPAGPLRPVHVPDDGG